MDADRREESPEGTVESVGDDDARPLKPREHILELRVHGVSNTPPAALLEVGQDDVQKVRGDSLGSFWMLTPAALKHARTVSAAHHDHVSKEVRREAYSW